MSRLGIPIPPDHYSQQWMEDFLNSVEQKLPRTREPNIPIRIELNADAGLIPVYFAAYPVVVRRVSFWSPIAVDADNEFYTLLDVRNHGPGGSPSMMPSGERFSTSSGLAAAEWNVVVPSDEEGEGGRNLVVERNQTVVIEFEHFSLEAGISGGGGGGGGLTEGTSQGEFTSLTDRLPEETGALLVELWVQVEVERA